METCQKDPICGQGKDPIEAQSTALGLALNHFSQLCPVPLDILLLPPL